MAEWGSCTKRPIWPWAAASRLKVLTSQMLNDPSQVLRFEREARSAANLHHTNIVPVFGVGEHDGTHFYVMQFIQGRGLDAVLAERQKSRHGDSSWSGPGDPPGVPGRTHSAAAIVDETGAPLPRFDSSGSMTTEAHCDPALFETGRGLARQVARIGVQVAEALAYAHARESSIAISSPQICFWTPGALFGSPTSAWQRRSAPTT